MKIYVIRVSPLDNKIMNSRPCNNCIEYMRLFDVKWVYYSNSEGGISKEKVKDMPMLHDCIAIRSYNFFKSLEQGKTIDTNDTTIKGFINFRKKVL